jgi:hypothetical protein
MTGPVVTTPAPLGDVTDQVLTTPATVAQPPALLQPTPDDARHQRDPAAAPDPPVLDASPVHPVGGFATRPVPSTATALVPPPITTAGPIAPGPIPVGADGPPAAHNGARVLLPDATRFLPPAASIFPAAAMPATESATGQEGGTAQAPTELPAPPPVGSVGGGSAAAAAVASSAALAILFVLLLVPCLRYGRVVLAPARWRPVLFVSLLERPG